MTWEKFYTNNLTRCAARWLLCACADPMHFRSVSTYTEMQRGAFILTECNPISDADSCKQVSVDIVYSHPPDNAVSGWDVTCHSSERMYLPARLPAFPSSCQPQPGLTRRGKANWILNTFCFWLSPSFISTTLDLPYSRWARNLALRTIQH